LLWRHLYTSKKDALSAGRCQTPALCLVYDNQREIDRDTPRTSYRTTARFFPHPFTLTCALKEGFDDVDAARAFGSASRHFFHTWDLGDPRDVVRAPPTPFNTSALLQTANQTLHYAPKVTNALAQKLYQDGHITYLRTESRQYATAFLDKATAFVAQRWGANHVGDRAAIDNVATGLPH
jgi:DNA topoisomerase-1